MSIPIDLRNKLAFRRVVRCSAHSLFSSTPSKFININTGGFEVSDISKFNSLLSNSLLGGRVNLVSIIDDTHRQYDGLIFEDANATKAFLNGCKKELSNVN